MSKLLYKLLARNLILPFSISCVSILSGTSNSNTVNMHTCFSWRTHGNDANCDIVGVWPGTVSKW